MYQDNPGIFPIGDGFGWFVFSTATKLQISATGGAQAHLQAESPPEKETNPVNAKRVGAAVFTVRPPLCLAKR